MQTNTPDNAQPTDVVKVPKSEQKEEVQRLNKKALTGDLLYGAAKSIGGAALRMFNKLVIDGKDNIPMFGKAILVTISKNPMLDMVVITQLTGRKVHFMVNPKLMKAPVVGPALKTLGMFRSTLNKEDKEPVEKVFDILNNKGNLVAMTPEARLSDEVQLKSVAAIIKFAVAAEAPIVPLAIYSETEALWGIIPVTRLRVRIGKPIKMEKKLNRERYREERYKQAEEIIRIVYKLQVDEKQAPSALSIISNLGK